jgi:hypothetical protein
MAEKPAKVSKASVRYGRGKMTRHCGVCEHFRKPKSCVLVAGDIDPGAWCRLFERAKMKEKNA